MKLELNRDFAKRHLAVAAFALGLAIWFGYDALVIYPAQSAHDLYVAIEKSEPPEQIDLETFKARKIKAQYGLSILGFAISLIIVAGVLVNRRRTLEWDDEKMEGSLTGGRPLAFDEVTEVDDSRWEKHGIMVLKAKDGRCVKLDSWHQNGVDELAKRFLPEECEVRNEE